LLKKDTVPAGMPDAGLTVAVSVTAWPWGTGFGDTWSDVVVVIGAAALTVSVTTEELEASKVLLPAYCAVNV
jgi:hypothetical protein